MSTPPSPPTNDEGRGDSLDDDHPSDDQAVLKEQQLAIVLAELTDRICAGEMADLETACREHPELANDLRHLWGAVLVTDTAGAIRDEMPGTRVPKSSLTSSTPFSSAQPITPESSGNEPSPTEDSWTQWRSLRLPTTVGDYDLLEEVGRGGMGVVFRAHQRSLDREVAIKMILRGRLASDADMHRFLAEAAATASLEHPGIVPVYEVGDVEGRPFFSMKFIDGETLAQRVGACGPLNAREACELIVSIAQAVEVAHSAGILHRDIKPSNILINTDGRPMLTDFGLAKQVGAKVDLTRSGMLVGTPAYMSPEQASGRKQDVGIGSDIYSLGCVLYYSLTGRAPFVADNAMELVMMVIEQEPTPPRRLRPSLDRDLEMIVTRCLQKPADLRYENSQALIGDLQAYLADERVSARSGHFNQVVARVFRETHHAAVLEKWGLLWMWHSLVLLVASLLTWQMSVIGVERRSIYVGVWVLGLGAWAAVFWKLRQRMGPVTFIERQVAHVWGASMIAIAMLFPMEWWLGLEVLTLAPLLGVISAMVFIVKAGMLSGAFYLQAISLLLASVAMAVFPVNAHLIFGFVAAACFFFPGLKYERQRGLML